MIPEAPDGRKRPAGQALENRGFSPYGLRVPTCARRQPVPIYEYQCDACGKRLEVTQRMSDKPLKQCPHCKKKKLRKLISVSAFQLKGTGWYVTDFRDKKAQKKGKSKPETEKAVETKSAEKETAKSADTSDKKPAEKKVKAKDSD